MERALTEFRTALRSREETAVEKMRADWQAARTGIFKRLEALLKKMQEAEENGQPITPSWLLSQARYRELLDQIDSEVLTLVQAQTQPLADAQRDMAQTAVEAAPALTRAALGTPPPGAHIEWNRLPAASVEAIAGFASDGSPLSDLLHEFGQTVSVGLRGALLEGAAAGLSYTQIATNVQAIVGTEKGGITESRAVNLVRTELHRAARAASSEAYARNINLMAGWVWVSARDTRSCSCCWAMHGTFHNLAERLDGHCQCRCCMAPRTKSWAEILGDDSLPDTRPVIESGEALFAKLTEDEQKSILGLEKHRLYSEGKITLTDTVTQTHDARWGSMRVVANLAQCLESAEARTTQTP